MRASPPAPPLALIPLAPFSPREKGGLAARAPSPTGRGLWGEGGPLRRRYWKGLVSPWGSRASPVPRQEASAHRLLRLV